MNLKFLFKLICRTDTFIACNTMIKDSRPEAVNESFFVEVEHPSTGSYGLFAPEKFVFKPNPTINEVYPLNSIVQ